MEYQKPEMLIIMFDAEDVIATSPLIDTETEVDEDKFDFIVP